MLSNAKKNRSRLQNLTTCAIGNLSGPLAVTLTKKLKDKKRFLLWSIHHFNSDLINNMDHMRISGTEPSSVILSQNKYLQKVKRCVPNVPKQAESKWDDVINLNLQNCNFKQKFNKKKFDALKRYEPTKVDRRTWLHVPSGTHWSNSSDTHQVV